MGKAQVGRFSDGEVQVEIEENVRRQEVFVVQPTSAPTADEEFHGAVGAGGCAQARLGGECHRGASVLRCARQDRRPRSARVAITAKVAAKMISAVGTDRVLTVDLHADPEIGGSSISRWTTCTHRQCCWRTSRYYARDDLIVVSPDVGGVVRARAIAKRLDDADLAIIDKRRPRPNEATVMNIIGEVKDKVCVLVDDVVDTRYAACSEAAALKHKWAL